MTLEEIAEWLNTTYPSRDWNQWCQRLVWNVVHVVSGTPEGRMSTYDTATAARHASEIESTNADAAPSGAIHYWKNPVEGHVGVSLGGEKVLMTGTRYALGEGGKLLGNNYGETTVSAYSSRMGNPYLGWSRTNGANASIVGKIGGSAAGSEDEMIRIIKTDNGDTLVVNHGDMSYWNVHEGIPAADVPKRVEWLKAQGMIEVQGLQPAAMLRGYSWVHAPENEARAAKAAAEKILPGGGSAAITDADVQKIAAAVNDVTADRLKQ